MRPLRRTMPVLLLACTAAACGKTTEKAPAAAAEKVAPAPAAAKAPAEKASSPAKAAAALEPSKAMEHATTPADRLGTTEDDLGLAPGAKVPGFLGHTVDGKRFDSTSMLAAGPALVCFYRGGWCPYCNHQVRAMTESAAKFTELGVTPVMVSVDQVEGALVTRATYKIPFPVISDPDLSMHKAFNVILQVPDEVVGKLAGYGIDIEAWSGRDHHKMAVPGVFLIARDGTVAWRHVAKDYKTRPSVDQLLGAVKAWKE